jgi:hypothetical protein
MFTPGGQLMLLKTGLRLCAIDLAYIILVFWKSEIKALALNNLKAIKIVVRIILTAA